MTSIRAIRYLIFASPKSGTTWLQRLLSAHPDVHCGETRLFGRHVDPSRPSGLGITLESYVANLERHLHAPAPGCSTFSHELLFDLADQVARTCLRHAGKTIYGEKQTPYLGTAAQVIDRACEYDPQLRLIHLVRDGRDVVVSGAAQWRNLTRSPDIGGARPEPGTPEETGAPAGVPEEYFEMFARHWVEAVSAFDAGASRFAHRLVVRYEDMLASPLATAGRILEFIGAPASPSHVSACVEAASFRTLSGGRSSGEEDPRSFFRKGAAGDWRCALSVDQIDRFERLAGPWLARYGYEHREPSIHAEMKPSHLSFAAPAAPR